MRLMDEIESLELEIENVPDEIAKNFIDSRDWKERLRPGI